MVFRKRWWQGAQQQWILEGARHHKCGKCNTRPGVGISTCCALAVCSISRKSPFQNRKGGWWPGEKGGRVDGENVINNICIGMTALVEELCISRESPNPRKWHSSEIAFYRTSQDTPQKQGPDCLFHPASPPPPPKTTLLSSCRSTNVRLA